jgi:hypothetical protein
MPLQNTTLCTLHSMYNDKVEACCASNNANQCPGRYMQDKDKGGSERCIWRRMHFQSGSKVYQYDWGGKCTNTFYLPPKVYQYILGEKSTSTFISPYWLLNLENLDRSTKGTRMFCFSPLDFASKKLPGTSLFCHEASANQPIQVK